MGKRRVSGGGGGITWYREGVEKEASLFKSGKKE